MVAANIAALRKGFKNQWKSWFGGQRPASEREGVTLIEGRPPLYAHIALEAQMRQFADLVFMLGDYDLALQVRLVGVGLALGWRWVGVGLALGWLWLAALAVACGETRPCCCRTTGWYALSTRRTGQ